MATADSLLLMIQEIVNGVCKAASTPPFEIHKLTSGSKPPTGIISLIESADISLISVAFIHDTRLKTDTLKHFTQDPVTLSLPVAHKTENRLADHAKDKIQFIVKLCMIYTVVKQTCDKTKTTFKMTHPLRSDGDIKNLTIEFINTLKHTTGVFNATYIGNKLNVSRPMTLLGFKIMDDKIYNGADIGRFYANLYDCIDNDKDKSASQLGQPENTAEWQAIGKLVDMLSIIHERKIFYSNK